jgi:DNA (cytosine-5)-methyltransferase 1
MPCTVINTPGLRGCMTRSTDPQTRLTYSGTVCGLFAGVGGLEQGLHDSGFTPVFLSEINVAAQAVLRERFPDVRIHPDVSTLDVLPPCDVLAAGFPCQDLSMAGRKVGIEGDRSGLVTKLLGLLSSGNPRWVVIENVPYMLHLNDGAAMAYLTSSLTDLGFNWAYRVVDARAFGVPQRRHRVILVASRSEDPRGVLFSDETEGGFDDSTSIVRDELAYGFYWTEGKRGLGWAVDSVPTIKGGSSVGIPSPPAIWVRKTGEIGTPDIRDLERLQGMPVDWTSPADDVGRAGGKNPRWPLVGNAVCVPMARWVGRRLRDPGSARPSGTALRARERWPNAAWGGPSTPPHKVTASMYPVLEPMEPLLSFLKYPLKPLSARACLGYLKRASEATTLRFTPGFLEAVRSHQARMSG